MTGSAVRPAVRRAGLVAAAALAVGCLRPGPGAPALPPSDAAAREHLGRIVAVVLSGDLERLCELGDGTCGAQLRAVDPATVPRLAPLVVASEAIDPVRRADGLWATGGRLLRLCGRDGRGRPYASEMLVFVAEGRLVATGAVFWTDLRIAREPVVGGAAPAIGCPADGS